MKAVSYFTAGCAVILLAGCASPEPGKRLRGAHRTTIHGVDEQPMATVTSVETSMPGARDSDAPGSVRDGAAGRKGFGTGVGSLGQSGIQPGHEAAGSTLPVTPTNPSLTPPPESAGAAPGIEKESKTPARANQDARNESPAPAVPGAPGAGGPDLSGRIHDALRSDPVIREILRSEGTQGFDIETYSGDVVLRGVVPTEREKKLIETKVQKVPGVRSVNSQLRVTETPR